MYVYHPDLDFVTYYDGSVDEGSSQSPLGTSFVTFASDTGKDWIPCMYDDLMI